MANITFNCDCDMGVSFVDHRGVVMTLHPHETSVLQLISGIDTSTKDYYVSFYDDLVNTLNIALELNDGLSVAYDIPDDWGGGGSGGGGVIGVKGSAEVSFRRGNVSISPENIGLGNVNDTADIDKPISTLVQASLDNKADLVSNAVNGHLAGLDAYGNIIDSGVDPTDLSGIDMVDGAIYEDIIDNVALKFSSDSDFTLSASKNWDGTLEYTLDNGSTWTTWDGSDLSGTTSQPIYLRGTGNSIITGEFSYDDPPWTFTGKYCTGNIENLLDYQMVANSEHPVMDAYCYSNMFHDCTSLTQAPELPATTLAATCYENMFYGCTSLIKAPELPATALAYYCYSYMFCNCTSLTQAPELPATILADGCYVCMFSYCISLTTAPELPATTLAEYCYRMMFKDCTSLKFSTTQTGEYQYAYRIPIMDTGTTALMATQNMFKNTGGTFTDDPTINTTYYTTNKPV